MRGRHVRSQEQDWLKNNLVAVPCGVVGNCSACIFRNSQNFCAKMSCSYFDNDTDFIETVYWTSIQAKNVMSWTELADWFNSTPPKEIRQVSYAVMKNAVLDKMQKTR